MGHITVYDDTQDETGKRGESYLAKYRFISLEKTKPGCTPLNRGPSVWSVCFTWGQENIFSY